MLGSLNFLLKFRYSFLKEYIHPGGSSSLQGSALLLNMQFNVLLQLSVDVDRTKINLLCNFSYLNAPLNNLH